MKHIFIINSISGKGKAKKMAPIIEEVCKDMNINYELVFTEYQGHTKEIASKYSPKDDVTLYSVGGDGTILEILNGIDSEIPLGVIPGGSGEDFFRCFNLDTKNIKKYIRDTIEAEPIKIDIGETNKMKFINTTSFGIDATINENASEMIRRTILTKGPAYILSIIKNVIIMNATKTRLVVDGKKYDGDYLIVCCMNGKYYGNGVCSAPHSDIQDGYFDLILLEKIKTPKIYKLLINYLTGNIDKSPEIKTIHAKNIIIDTNEIINIQSDGENYKLNHLEINIKESYLKLKIPASK